MDKPIPKVSIIVPVYNVSPYLEKCLDSIIHQTLIEIEIIIINDCSPDSKDDVICQKYANNDSRIIYLKHTQNLGLGGARNTGISRASAPYIGFVDSDDYIDTELFKIAYNEAIKGDFDMVVFGYTVVHEKTNTSKIRIPTGITKDDRDLLGNYLQEQVPNPASWNKLWKRSLFIDNNIEFPQHIYFEDIPVTAKVLYYAKSIKYLNDVLYYYFHREGSIIRSFSKKHIDDHFTILNILIDFLISKDKAVKYQKQVQICFWKMIQSHLNSGLSLATAPEKEHTYEYLRNSIISSNLVDLRHMLTQLTPIQCEFLFRGFPFSTSREIDFDLLLEEFKKYKSIKANRWYRFGKLSRFRKIKTIIKYIFRNIFRNIFKLFIPSLWNTKP